MREKLSFNMKTHHKIILCAISSFHLHLLKKVPDVAGFVLYFSFVLIVLIILLHHSSHFYFNHDILPVFYRKAEF